PPCPTRRSSDLPGPASDSGGCGRRVSVRGESGVAGRAVRVGRVRQWATGEQVADLHQEVVVRGGGLDALALGGGLFELVHRGDQHEVDDRGDQQEVDDGGDEQPEVHDGLRVVVEDLEGEAHLVVAAEECDEGVDDRAGERIDDRGERRADHDSDRQVDHVALHDEFLETLEHASHLSRCNPCLSRLLPRTDERYQQFVTLRGCVHPWMSTASGVAAAAARRAASASGTSTSRERAPDPPDGTPVALAARATGSPATGASGSVGPTRSTRSPGSSRSATAGSASGTVTTRRSPRGSGE